MTTAISTRASRPAAAARATILAAASLTIMGAAIIAPSLPAMTAAYAGTPGAEVLVRLTLTVTSLAIAVTAPVAGLLADRVGRRPLLLTSLALYALAGTAGFLITDLGVLIASRALLGAAVGGVMTAVSTVIADWFDGPGRARFLGLQQASASLGGVVFLPLAGVLAGISWRSPFLLYAVAALILPAAALFLRESARRTGTANVTPTATAPAAGARREIIGVYALAAAVTVIFYMAPTQLPFRLTGFHTGTAMTGVVIAGSTLTGIAGALAFPRLRRRLHPATITALSIALLGAGWAVAGTATVLAQLAAGVLIGGLGVGLVVPNLNTRLAEIASAARRGRILGGLVTAIFLGQFLSPLLMQPIVDALGIAATFTYSGAVLLAGAATALGARYLRR
ncbi:MFS transporter [Paractinoplanes deccanensis]|uniref:MFS transporter n=1 Tax=Paractinoplanes deccanensis TaxID=113561 RepID=A0ABQ3YK14_9ACTN|nr:MFS transporter [Actinoplanes deccanensis]GID80343.1 MFS transporter [Actinoplanes deccanensis]